MVDNSTRQYEHIFVARQPIFTSQLDVYAYELLYRSGEENTYALETDGDLATSNVILNTFMEIGFDRIVGRHKAFINLTRSFIEGEFPLPFPNDRVVLEVLEDVPPEPEVIKGLQQLAKRGFKIALDDFVYERGLQPLVELADIIKIDIQNAQLGDLGRYVARFANANVKLLAEKVETLDEFEQCKALGFEYFQGYFLARPKIIKGHKMPANSVAMLKLLARLQDQAASIDELEALIKCDVSLSYKLLRYINSPAIGIKKEISSIQQAIVFLGLNTLKRWVTLITLAGIAIKPHELIRTAMIRGKMCELMGEAKHEKDLDAYFSVGLFSALDAILDLPMSEVIDTLPLEPEVTQALLTHTGRFGDALSCVLTYERGQWDQVKLDGMSHNDIRRVYLSAIDWAESMTQGFST